MWLGQLCYLHDMFTHLNYLNTSMQGPNTTLVDTLEKVTSFQQKIDLWIAKMDNGQTAAFPTLSSFLEDNPGIFDMVKPIALAHLQHLHTR